jgi:hypothetical protein
MPVRRKSARSVWLAVVAIFLSGAVTGVLGVAFFVHHLAGRVHSRGPHAFEAVALEFLDWQLDLDEAQEDRVSGIIGDLHLDLMRFKAEHSGEFDALLATGLDRIQATLTDEQREDWGDLRARIEASHRVPLEDAEEQQHGAGE